MKSTTKVTLLLSLAPLLTVPAFARQETVQKAEKPATASTENWKPLWDGKSLTGWKLTDFFKPGKVHIEEKFHGDTAAIVVNAGSTLSGINWAGDPVPTTNYEISLDTIKLDGQDFMCGLTFPVGKSHASLILGGWGGSVAGISSLDGLDASENETQKSVEFVKNHWYHVRVRVTDSKLQAWLDDKQIVNVDISGKKVSLRIGDIMLSVPIGICNYQTTSAFRDVKIRSLTAAEIAASVRK